MCHGSRWLASYPRQIFYTFLEPDTPSRKYVSRDICLGVRFCSFFYTWFWFFHNFHNFNWQAPMSVSNHAPSFGDWARAATITRAQTENWTHADCVAAVFQTSLLSFTSPPDGMSERGVGPSDFLHNAPWNDWVPPSKSRHRFQDAQANQPPDRVRQRVRARLCSSLDAGSLERSKLVFATAEMDERGDRCLRLRRGAHLLASLPIACLDITRVGRRAITLAPLDADTRPESEPDSQLVSSRTTVLLVFDTEARMTRLQDMLGA